MATSTVLLVATVVGTNEIFRVSIGLDCSVAALVAGLKNKLRTAGLPYNFTTFTTKQGENWPLTWNSFDFEQLARGDVSTTEKYTLPDLSLEPSKQVIEYFEDAKSGDTIHIVLVWPHSEKAKYAACIEAQTAWLASQADERWPETARLVYTPIVPPPREAITTWSSWVSSIDWFWLCFPLCSPSRVLGYERDEVEGSNE